MDVLEPLITNLHNEGRLRVWSLVVTVFGDAVQHRGGRIAMLRLQHLLERIGVEAGALRTALSRLSSDGWVLRDREGRNSFYRLSENGQTEVTAAAANIYRQPRAGEIQNWAMACGTQAPVGGIEVAASVWLIPSDKLFDLPDHICVTGALTSIPEGYKKQILSPAHADALGSLSNDIMALQGVELSPLDAMAARTLLIHRWRRIVLRFPDVPPELLPVDAALLDPRESVAQTYNQIVDLSERWLESTDHGLMPMPISTPEFLLRFGGGAKTASASQLGGGS